MLWQVHNMTEVNKLVFNSFGPPAEVLQREVSVLSEVITGKVLLRILAAPLNPADLNTIEGTYGVKPSLPAIPGIEGCGEVLESGSPDFLPGDHVIFLRRSSTWASHTIVPADTLFKIPKEIDPQQAAMLKVNPATAWRLLHGFRKPVAGNFMVQNAGNSAVGRCVIQLAPALGIQTISFVRRLELIDELKQLGADHVFQDNEEGLAAAQKIMGAKRAVLAFNSVGGESALRLMNLLEEGGTHITYGAMGRRPLTVPNGLLIFKDIQIRGLWVTRWIEHAATSEVQETYGQLASLMAAGKLIQPIDSTFPLERFPDALARLAAPDRNGKVLFVP